MAAGIALTRLPHHSMRKFKHYLLWACMALAGFMAGSANAQYGNLGFTQLPQVDGGKISLFYPTLAAEAPVHKGPFELSWAAEAPPSFGNGRLIVISHGS